MKLKMAENSLFAILLRSSWWISAAIAVGFVLAARALLPADYFVFGAMGAFPFVVIAAIAFWKQLKAPSPARIARTVEAVGAMSWAEFASALEDGFRRDGSAVERLSLAGADFELTKAGRRTVVAAKRWKSARVGVEQFRELDAAREKRDAHDAIWVGTGEITEQAARFATEKRIRLLNEAGLAQLLRGAKLPAAGKAAEKR